MTTPGNTVVGVLAEALAQHQPVALGLCWCGWSADPEDWEEWRGMHCAHVASVVAALPNIAVIEVPSVRYKAAGETDAQRYEEIAGRVERDHYVGGSNSRAAVAELLRRVSTSLAARAAGGQA